MQVAQRESYDFDFFQAPLFGPLSSELAMWTLQVQVVAIFARTVHPHTIPDNVNIYFSQRFYFGVNSLVSPTTCTIQFQSQAAQALAVFGNNPHKLGHNSLKQYLLGCGASIQISLENLQEMVRISQSCSCFLFSSRSMSTATHITLKMVSHSK